MEQNSENTNYTSLDLSENNLETVDLTNTTYQELNFVITTLVH